MILTVLIEKYEKQIENNITVFKFYEGQMLSKVEIVLKSEFSKSGNGKIKVSYAQNGITSDLLDFGEASAVGERIEISADSPVSATHVYITGADITADISLFAESNTSNASCYPAYFDTDLKENYYIDTLSVFTGSEGYSRYSVYTSLDGRDFEFAVSKTDKSPCDPKTGDTFMLDGREAKIIRVYIEYNSAVCEAVFKGIKFDGKPSGTPLRQRPEINIPAFDDSEYNFAVTAEDTYSELYGIVKRRLGAEYCSRFEFLLAENPKQNGHDFFELSDKDGHLLIKAADGVCLAAGLNYYLKYYCKVCISQVGDQTAMPEKHIPVGEKAFRETKAEIRYAYNYCTLSYSMAFWSEEEWRRELDWLALNGVNVVLDATAQEEVWRRFLLSLGYSHEEILKYIAGPAYYAWAYMANLSGFGGPVHDSWFSQRTRLARKNQLIMKKLGMKPVLQGYSGMVPNDILKHDAKADIIPQGTWCSFLRPAMLRTTSECFKEYAHKFYAAQKEVYGNDGKYFATDPFHEGGNKADMNAADISYEVLDAMLKENSEAVWIIQSWQGNPSSELLCGIARHKNGRRHALILDLYAEKSPNYPKGHKGNPNHGYNPEFDYTPWVYCMLNNFGGRLGLHGHLDNINSAVPEILNSCTALAGIGITPEASMNNPVLYDFLFEAVWKENADAPAVKCELEEWIREYACRRYGRQSENAVKAWKILLNTVYRAELNNLGQGAPESVMNARPSLEIKAASTWGNAVISYNKSDLRRAAEYLLADCAELIGSDGYKYDLITVLQQVLSNTAQDIYADMLSAYKSGSAEKFKKSASAFLAVADSMEEITSSSEYYMLGKWLEAADKLSAEADSFSKRLYRLNAKSLVTTWGAYNQCEAGGLHDYSNRQWSGLIKSYYKPRWERWIKARTDELCGEDFEADINWFEQEWNWVLNTEEFETHPSKTDLKAVGERILNQSKS